MDELLQLPDTGRKPLLRKPQARRQSAHRRRQYLQGRIRGEAGAAEPRELIRSTEIEKRSQVEATRKFLAHNEAHVDAALESLLIQRFGLALNFNIHFHMLFLDGVYAGEGPSPRFVPVPAPSLVELQGLVQTIAERIGRSLERAGLITRDAESCYLAFDPSEEASIDTLLAHSITYRIATGPREGHQVFALQTLPADPDPQVPRSPRAQGSRCMQAWRSKAQSGTSSNIWPGISHARQSRPSGSR